MSSCPGTDWGAALDTKKTDKTVTRVFTLSGRLSVEITAGVGGLTVEWIPRAPYRLTANELLSYRRARTEVLTDLVDIVGGAVVVVEAYRE